MRHVVGTAGHVDHGKSTLVHALTGTDPDRLPEEKRRGMTLDLGFAAWTLPGGGRVGVVDVPGHRRLVRTMVAGVHGIDLVLLVVATDEGVMPQTREHLAVCELLGVHRGVVALTKVDLVDPEMLEMARAETAQTLAGSALRHAPVVPCSARTGEGLEVLAHAVESALRGAPPRLDRERPRLFVDRAFSLPGFGPIVTGTLDGGALRRGDDVLLLPDGLRARVRALQHHGEEVGAAQPGMRTAVNLGGVERERLHRGLAVVRPGTVVSTARLDVHLTLLAHTDAALRHGAAVTVHLGTVETGATLRLLDGSAVEPGQSCWAQLHLDAAVAAVPGDRVVVRRPSPAATLGGGMILDVAPRRHRRHDAAVAASLQRRHGSDAAAAVDEELRKARLGAGTASLLPRTACSPTGLQTMLEGLARDGAARSAAGRWFAAERWADLERRSHAVLAAFHGDEPLRAGMPREQWRSRLRLPASLATELARALVDGGAALDHDGQLALPGRGGSVSDRTRATADAIRGLLEGAALDPPPMPELHAAGLTPQLLRLLVEEGHAVRLAPDVVLAASAYASARRLVEEHLRSSGTATVAQLRDRLGATRRVVVPLLEHLDAARVTVRDGDLRRLRTAAPATATATAQR